MINFFLSALVMYFAIALNVAAAQTAKVQVIHNSALPAAAEVDVYINGAKPDALDNFAFRSATPYVDLPAGEDIIVTVAEPTSMDAEDKVIATFNLGMLEAGMEYVVFANGIIGETFANPDPDNRSIGFNLYPLMGRMAAENMDNVEFNVFHGATDAPAVDVYTDIDSPALVSNLDYTESTGYVSVPDVKYDLTVTVAGNKETVAGKFEADLTGLAGGTAVVFASGFLAPDNQGTSVPDGYGFGLYAALADGTVIELPAMMDKGSAKVQVIHNSALPAAAEVDVYINGAKPDALDNFAFRSATPYVDLPAGEDIIVTIAEPKSMDAEDKVIATFNLGMLEAGMEYVVFANGIIGETFANPDPDNRSIGFNLYPLMGRMAAENMDNVEFNVFHGATDAPAVDVYTDVNSPALVSDLNYTESTGYVSVPPTVYNLTVTVAGDKNIVAGQFRADLNGLKGGAAVVFASGFLAPDNQGIMVPGDYGFGLYAALPDGTVLKLDALSSVIENTFYQSGVDLYPNPAQDKIRLESTRVPIDKIFIYNSQGEKIMAVDNSAVTGMDLYLNKLSSGKYYLRAYSGSRIITKQFVVQR